MFVYLESISICSSTDDYGTVFAFLPKLVCDCGLELCISFLSRDEYETLSVFEKANVCVCVLGLCIFSLI